MKKFSILIIAALLATCIMAQEKISAKSIIEKINKGEDISIKNKIIEGDLMFIYIDNKEVKENDSNTSIYYIVDENIEFRNCTFKGKIIAFEHENMNRTSHIANFHGAVNFIDCKINPAIFKHSEFKKGVNFAGTHFKQEANFKHAEFEGNSNFEKSVFEEEANFKHSEFDMDANFSNCTFVRNANFKHTDFDGQTLFDNSDFKSSADFKHVGFPACSFTKCVFERVANFKHANFKKGVNFSETIFKGDIDFKHTNFKSLIIKGTKFKGDMDAKHALIGGKSMVNVLLNSK